MKIISICLLALPFFSCNEREKDNPEQTPANTDSLLITETNWGMIRQNMGLEDLRELFGGNEVKDSTIYGPEGMDTLQVTFLLSGKPGEIIVNWRDSFYHQKISFIEAYNPASPYHTERGLKIGSSLKELLAANGKQINFTGFGWDYGGYIMSYNGGKLDSADILFTLSGFEEMPDGLYGDSELNTSDSLVQKYLDKIRIGSMMLRFNEH
jgi:hypothetical protein